MLSVDRYLLLLRRRGGGSEVENRTRISRNIISAIHWGIYVLYIDSVEDEWSEGDGLIQRIKMHGENYDLILGISTYYTDSYIIDVFMTSYMTSYLYMPGASVLLSFW